MKDLSLRAKHGRKDVRIPALRAACRELLDGLLNARAYDLTVLLVDDAEMARANGRILQHAGTTDVITLDFSDAPPARPLRDGITLSGLLYVCVPEARRNARAYGVHWTEELCRYIIHGVLHLTGHDDTTASKRRAMHAEQERLVAALRGRVRVRDVAVTKGAK
jgi:probable rRNA maturation factor